MLLYINNFGLSCVLFWVPLNLKFSSKTEYATHLHTHFAKNAKFQNSKSVTNFWVWSWNKLVFKKKYAMKIC